MVISNVKNLLKTLSIFFWQYKKIFWQYHKNFWQYKKIFWQYKKITFPSARNFPFRRNFVPVRSATIQRNFCATVPPTATAFQRNFTATFQRKFCSIQAKFCTLCEHTNLVKIFCVNFLRKHGCGSSYPLILFPQPINYATLLYYTPNL